MTTNELRCGNLVSDITDEFGGMGTVKVQMVNDAQQCVFVRSMDDEILVEYVISSICGIPLTPEWLIKAGFVKDAGWIIHLQEKLWLSVDLPIEGSSRKTSDICITWDHAGRWITGKVNCVHQLQNLYYALTGKELNFNPS